MSRLSVVFVTLYILAAVVAIMCVNEHSAECGNSHAPIVYIFAGASWPVISILGIISYIFINESPFGCKASNR